MLYEINDCYLETSADAEDIKMAVRKLINEYGFWAVYELKELLKRQGYYVSDKYSFDEEDERNAYTLINFE